MYLGDKKGIQLYLYWEEKRESFSFLPIEVNIQLKFNHRRPYATRIVRSFLKAKKIAKTTSKVVEACVDKRIPPGVGSVQTAENHQKTSMKFVKESRVIAWTIGRPLESNKKTTFNHGYCYYNAAMWVVCHLVDNSEWS